LLSIVEALLLHGETRPLTGLPARATSAASNVREGMRWEEANRSLWPNSEFHEEFLPAMPALLLTGVQNKYTTVAMRLAIGFALAVRVPCSERAIEIREATGYPEDCDCAEEQSSCPESFANGQANPRMNIDSRGGDQ
jgi:hypothetical protein